MDIRIIFRSFPSWLKEPLRRLREMLIDIHATKSYSQEGEDMVLQRIFAGEECGFYVDVGAHHPHRFSNTNFFYKRGWRGINIEPNPAAIEAFRVDRKGDINLQLGVAEQPGSLKYYFFDEPALNSFDGELVKQRLASTQYKVVRTSDIPVERLDHILAEYLPPDTKVDFLSIDVEGLDFEVLKSNNWDLCRPKCVLVESLETTLEDAMNGELYQYMKNNGYKLFAKTYNTFIFCDGVA